MSSLSLPPNLTYRQNQLWLEEVPLSRLVNEVGTPAYVYSRTRLLDNFRRFDEAFHALSHLVLFAMKANSNLAVLNLLAGQGAGFDLVSGGELLRVIAAGGDPVDLAVQCVETLEDMGWSDD